MVSIAYHLNTSNKDNWLSTNFGLDKWDDFTPKEKLLFYRRFLYQVGAVGEKGVIPAEVVESDKRKKYQYSRIERFRWRTRWFTDSGIIGSKKFVTTKEKPFREIFATKRQKRPSPISGISSVFSLKRLSKV